MIDKNRTYKTRDGREVRIYATDGEGPYPVHGAIRLPNLWSPTNWSETGEYRVPVQSHDYDLIEVRPRHKRTVWLNVYQGSDHGSYYDTKLHADADAAAKHQRWPRVACIKVELDFEEGEGL